MVHWCHPLLISQLCYELLLITLFASLVGICGRRGQKKGTILTIQIEHSNSNRTLLFIKLLVLLGTMAKGRSNSLRENISFSGNWQSGFRAQVTKCGQEAWRVYWAPWDSGGWLALSSSYLHDVLLSDHFIHSSPWNPGMDFCCP